MAVYSFESFTIRTSVRIALFIIITHTTIFVASPSHHSHYTILRCGSPRVADSHLAAVSYNYIKRFNLTKLTPHMFMFHGDMQPGRSLPGLEALYLGSKSPQQYAAHREEAPKRAATITSGNESIRTLF
jgi:hypothetical protein